MDDNLELRFNLAQRGILDVLSMAPYRGYCNASEGLVLYKELLKYEPLPGRVGDSVRHMLYKLDSALIAAGIFTHRK